MASKKPEDEADSAPLRVVICSYQSAYTHAFLNEFTKCQRVKVVGLVRSTSLSKGRRSNFQDDLRLLRRSGVFYALYMWFVTSPILPALMITRWLTMAKWAKKLGCHLLLSEDVNKAKHREEILGWEPDLIVSVHFNQIYSREFIEKCPCQLWNIHPALLPKNKGLDPSFYALLHGEEETGVTLHEIAPEIDEGEVLAQEKVKIEKHVLHALNFELFSMAGRLLSSYLTGDTASHRHHNQFYEPSYNSWPSRRDVWRFLVGGARIF